MKRLLLVTTGLLLTIGVAHAKKDCTSEPKEKWMKEADFKMMIEGQGYTIRKFKQPGTCYEIYGKNKEGKSVEIYFNPVDGSIVKSK
ncbi:MAG: PepSY domain-containing protein [Alphaproteobacteria bacterium]|nr:MAG: PepSY domain-containing protein [Alphaproteobacteria bacterium]